MKKLLDYNNNQKAERINQYMQENSDLFKKRFGNNYQFVKDYPFVLSYPDVEYKKDEFCKTCGQKIPQNPYRWEDGFRPNIEDVGFDWLHSPIGHIIEEQKHMNGTDFEKEYEEFMIAFKNLKI